MVGERLNARAKDKHAKQSAPIFYFFVPRRAQVQGRIEHVVRVYVYNYTYMMTESKIKESRYSITSRIQRNRIWCRYMAFIP